MEKENEFKQYRRSQIAELRPYLVGEGLGDRISVSTSDKENGSPKAGDMVARNPKNHEDQWLVAEKYFKDNFEELKENITFHSTDAMENRIIIDNEVISNKQLRVDLDKQLQELKSLSASRERSLAITKLQECIMWLGMDLKRLNEPNPYPNSYNPSNDKIEPTADGLKL